MPPLLRPSPHSPPPHSQDPEIAEAAGVMGTPTVQMFKDKARVEQLSGVKMKKDYREIISRHVGVAESVKVPA